ncbi:MAG: methylated-DNA--[protein]-cysteine S-methyltransferase [Planctomycetota bacterium]
MGCVHQFFDSPVGRLKIVTRDDAVIALLWPSDTGGGRVPNIDSVLAEPNNADHVVLRDAICQLQQYFAGERQQFTVPVCPRGTDFQRRVWTELQQIPFGQTTTYQQLAIAIGRPSASRAVGAANGKNPISILIPCHRVIGKSGSLTGFAGGIDTKSWLLDWESGPLFAD